MSNGKLLAEYKRKLDCGETIPQTVTNAVMIEALVEIYGMIDEVKEFMSSSKAEKEVEAERDKDHLSGRQLWNDYGKDVVKLIITIVVAAMLAKLI